MITSYPIPDHGKVLVKEEEKIDFNTPLFENKVSKEVEVNITKELGINPKNIFRYVTKLVGDNISKGNTLAIKKGFLFTKKVKSPYDGVIKEINHHQGIILIDSTDKTKNQIISPFKGEVVKISKNHLDISVSKGQEFSLKKATNDFGGEVFYLKTDQFFDITSAEVEKKIIVSKKIASFTQTKLEALGAKAFITLEDLVNETDLSNATFKNIDDMEKVEKNKLTYCTIISKPAKIYFYQ